MLTYELKKAPGAPLYEALYRCIRADILSGALQPGQKLPSKRALAQNLEVSKITVETAYQQLLSEGFIRSREKVGYFVEPIRRAVPPKTVASSSHEAETTPMLELTAGGSEGFPFSVWSRLQREVMLDHGETLLKPLPNRGIPELRQAIAGHLAAFRGMHVDPENILIGAGTDFLYNLLIQLLGRDKVYAVEEPGYGKIRRIYSAAGATTESAPMDENGVIPQALGEKRVLHISPSHHFPTGIVTPLIYQNINTLKKVALTGFLISLTIEIIQLPFAVRASDVDDLILNTAGCLVGYGIYALVRAIHRKNRQITT